MKKLLTLLLIAVFAFTGAGCANTGSNTPASTAPEASGSQSSSNSSSDKGVTIRVGDLSSYELIKDADEKGFFKEEFSKDGVTVEVKSFQSGPPELEALTAKDLDFALMGDQPAVQGVANEIGIQVVSGLLDGTHGNGLIAREDAGISKVSDLKGKKVGVPVGTTAHQLLIKMLEKNSLKTSDIQLVNLAAGDIVTSLQTGNIQAAVTFEPSLAKAVASGGIKKISDAEGYKEIINVIVGRTEFTKEHPDLAVRFLKVIKKTAEWRDSNFEESLGILAKRTGVDKEALRASASSMPPLLALKDSQKQAILETAQYLKNNNIIRRDLTVEQIFNDEYAVKAGIQ